tara:strand:- start:4958 stop:5485 length:528 start_codon:yes stop_codon:yes gene_type:complete
MALKSYIMTRDFKSPVVRATGDPRSPQSISMKRFKKGEIVNGELKHANNKPAFLLVKGVCVVPLDVIKEVVTKDIMSNASGGEPGASKEISFTPQKETPKTQNSNPKVKYIDAMLIGGIIGAVGVYAAEKQGWIEAGEGHKQKMIGGAVGALAGAYIIYRTKTEKPVKITKSTKE